MTGGEKSLDDCVCEICIGRLNNKFTLANNICYIFSDDVTTESVQYYTVKSKFTVSTLTCLDHLAVREDCECDVKQCVIKVNLYYKFYKYNTLETPPYTLWTIDF